MTCIEYAVSPRIYSGCNCNENGDLNGCIVNPSNIGLGTHFLQFQVLQHSDTVFGNNKVGILVSILVVFTTNSAKFRYFDSNNYCITCFFHRNEMLNLFQPLGRLVGSGARGYHPPLCQGTQFPLEAKHTRNHAQHGVRDVHRRLQAMRTRELAPHTHIRVHAFVPHTESELSSLRPDDERTHHLSPRTGEATRSCRPRLLTACSTAFFDFLKALSASTRFLSCSSAPGVALDPAGSAASL